MKRININKLLNSGKIENLDFKKYSKSIQKWLLNELKILLSGLKCTTRWNNTNVTYTVIWEVDDYGTIINYSFVPNKNTVLLKSLCNALNSSCNDYIYDIIKHFKEFKVIDNRIKKCCDVANRLEQEDENYNWDRHTLRGIKE